MGAMILGEVTLLTVLLSWNRPRMLEQTIESYLDTVSVPYRLVVVDNKSDDETVECLQSLSTKHGFEVIFLQENMGGRAYNIVLEREVGYRFVHFSENDLQYLPGWDRELLMKFECFPGIGQISPFSPLAQTDDGEIAGGRPPSHLVSHGQYSLFIAHKNVGGTSVVRRELVETGLTWSNLSRGNMFKFPNDSLFSQDIKKLGWGVAWNDRHLCVNWGHNISELRANLAYYIENYRSKPGLGIDGLRRRLNAAGYELIRHDGNYQIIDKTDRSNL